MFHTLPSWSPSFTRSGLLAASLTIIFIMTNAEACKPGQASTSGVIQLVGSTCMPDFGQVDVNTVKALCAAAFKVDVNKQGVMYITPLEQGGFKWEDLDLLPPIGPQGVLKCSNFNATGLLDASTPKVAPVMFYNDVGGPHSRLVATGPNKLTLVLAHTYSSRDFPPNCTFTYTVVSGCVMGIPAPAKPFTCPSGWYIKSGRHGRQYCAPCPQGSDSTGPNAKKCTPCPRGYMGERAGSKCTKCPGALYSPTSGAKACKFCDIYFTNVRAYTDGKSCQPCPPDSWANEQNPSQCVACNNGVRCCRTNPSRSCPACKPGFRSGTSTQPATFVLTSALPPACMRTMAAKCTTRFTVTVQPTCVVEHSIQTSVNFPSCFGTMKEHFTVVGGPKASWSDLRMSTFYSVPPKPVTAKGPFASFTINQPNWPSPAPNTCTFTYRAVTASASLLGVPPAPCSPGNPGCISKTSRKCPAGQFVQRNIDGNTLCVPCPVGFYTPSPTTSTKCTPCPAGHYSNDYGSTRCAVCPAGTYSTKNSAVCTPCGDFQAGESLGTAVLGYYSSTPGSSTCKPCPPNSAPENYDRIDLVKVTRCLGRSKGKMCCAAGDCSGQQACPKALRALQATESAIFQLQSARLSDPSCRSLTFFTCLSPKALVLVKPARSDRALLEIAAIRQAGCSSLPVQEVSGGYAATNRARFVQYLNNALSRHVTYDAVSDAATGTMKLYLSTSPTPGSFNPSNAKCWATFKLLAGYAFDLQPPPAASCPSGTAPMTQDGVVSCWVCRLGSIMKNGACQECPEGTYQAIHGGTKCLSCPPGTIADYTGAATCSPCYPAGEVPNADNSRTCSPCPAGTFAARGYASCRACPAGMVAPEGSSLCGIPFPK